jgi:hypothetical protein
VPHNYPRNLPLRLPRKPRKPFLLFHPTGLYSGVITLSQNLKKVCR